jgi:RNA polymerase sigma-70 factor (ECF subfamily)
MASGWFMAGLTAMGAPPSDLDIVRRMAEEDDSAAALLYDRYGAVLYAVAYRIVGQKADAEEVVMEAFVQAWRDAGRFVASRGSVAAWLTMIGRSRALDHVRSRERKANRVSSTEFFSASLDLMFSRWLSIVFTLMPRREAT